MNCCNDFGHCTNGQNCAIRRVNAMPIQRNSDGSDSGIEMLEKPMRWVGDLFYTAIYIVGSVALGIALAIALAWFTGLGSWLIGG